MTYEEKLKWLERLFSNDPSVRKKAMEDNVPPPLFETGEELGRAIDELLAALYVRREARRTVGRRNSESSSKQRKEYK